MAYWQRSIWKRICLDPFFIALFDLKLIIHQHRDAAQQAAEEQLGALGVVLVGEAQSVRSVGCGGEVGGEVGVVGQVVARCGFLNTDRITTFISLILL